MINRVGYDLTAMGTPAHMPDWAKDLTISTQKVMDDQYLHGPGGLDNFYGQGEAYLTTQAMKRGSNRNYVPDPFPMAIPRRQMVTFDADGNLSSAFLPTDPRIQMPVLDPLPPEQSGGISFGGAHPPTDLGPALDAIKAQLDRIETQISALLAGK